MADGSPDVIARNDTDGLLLLYPGEGHRDFSSAPPVEIGSGWDSYTFFGITDWDSDSHQDILARDDLTGDLILFPGEGVRGLSNEQPVVLAKGWNAYSPFGVGDWNHATAIWTYWNATRPPVLFGSTRAMADPMTVKSRRPCLPKAGKWYC